MVKLKLSFLLLWFCVSIVTANAQSSTFYSQYLDSPVFNNIGATAQGDYKQITTQYRNLTLGNGGLVHTTSLSYVHPLFQNVDAESGSGSTSNKRNFGGFNLAFTDHRAGTTVVYKNTALQGGFTYNLPLSKNKVLGMGIQANFMFRGLNFNSAETTSQINESGVFDGSLGIGESFGNEQSTSYMLNTGLTLQSYGENNERLYQVGVSILNLGQSTDSFVSESPNIPIAYIFTGDFLAYQKAKWSIRPHTRVISYNGVNLADIGANFRFYQSKATNDSVEDNNEYTRKGCSYFSAGLAYRTTGTAILTGSLQKKNLLIGASFDMPFAQTGEQISANNSLELLLAYQFGQ